MVEINPANEALVDISNICIDLTCTREERVRAFVEQVKNPYKFRVGDIVVSVKYEHTNDTLQSKLSKMLTH